MLGRVEVWATLPTNDAKISKVNTTGRRRNLGINMTLFICCVQVCNELVATPSGAVSII